jgi:flagellar biosynthesis/type III secretory pathway chaperone
MAPQPATSLPNANQATSSVVGEFHNVMEALLELVEQETELVRAGRVNEASALAARKSQLAGIYLKAVSQLRSEAPALRARNPAALKELRQRHEQFQAQLQINLTILATMHSVAEGIIRGVSQEVARKTAPQVYGASGRHAVANQSAGVPIAVSRAL